MWFLVWGGTVDESGRRDGACRIQGLWGGSVNNFEEKRQRAEAEGRGWCEVTHS